MATFRCSTCEEFNVIDRPAAGARCKACESLLDLSGNPQQVDAAALSRAIDRSPVPLFVDFWAPWCGPCVWSAPIVKAMAARLAGDVVVLAVNTQESPKAGEEHAIYAIPTFTLFQRGEEVSRSRTEAARSEVFARATPTAQYLRGATFRAQGIRLHGSRGAAAASGHRKGMRIALCGMQRSAENGGPMGRLRERRSALTTRANMYVELRLPTYAVAGQDNLRSSTCS